MHDAENPKNLTVRKASESEFPAVLALAREAFLQDVAPGQTEAGVRHFMEFASMEALRRRSESGYLTYVACRGSRLVGMAHVREGSHISMLFVLEGWRRRGVGRRLLAFAARESGACSFTVNSGPNAIGAYERMGFRPRAALQEQDGIRFLPMSLELRTGFAPEPSS